MELRIDTLFISSKEAAEITEMFRDQRWCDSHAQTGTVLTELSLTSQHRHTLPEGPWTRQHFMQKRNARLFPPGRHTQGIFQVPGQRVGSNVAMAEMPCAPPGVVSPALKSLWAALCPMFPGERLMPEIH